MGRESKGLWFVSSSGCWMFESFERQKVDTREHGNVVKLNLYVPENCTRPYGMRMNK